MGGKYSPIIVAQIFIPCLMDDLTVGLGLVMRYYSFQSFLINIYIYIHSVFGPLPQTDLEFRGLDLHTFVWWRHPSSQKKSLPGGGGGIRKERVVRKMWVRVRNRGHQSHLAGKEESRNRETSGVERPREKKEGSKKVCVMP